MVTQEELMVFPGKMSNVLQFLEPWRRRRDGEDWDGLAVNSSTRSPLRCNNNKVLFLLIDRENVVIDLMKLNIMDVVTDPRKLIYDPIFSFFN